MISGPCKDCAERQIGCHSTCKKYVDFRKRLDEKNKLEREKRLEIIERRNYINDTAKRFKRRYGNRK